ncbi:uncharacterized protein LOC124886667 [Capsicum annuum]|uniref:uncharacterized protein LOC124886667 n=1 Tax=Capsicum annuum TaxID=4072 RepID=UPI001FB1353B|nr:uncharacterized protein LOC124886667 [Capsicum annuum]
MAFDFSIEYKKGLENKAADALSRMPDAEVLAIAVPHDDLYNKIKDSWSTDSALQLCDICQRHKYDVAASPGYLQPLPIPEGVWTDICLDFIEGLPKFQGKDVILVLVDRLSKYAHFLSLQHPYTAQSVAKSFLDGVFKLHGMPVTMTSDRDPKPLVHFPYLVGESAVEMVDRDLAAREAIIQLIKFHIARAQQRMKDVTDKHRSDRSFEVGDWVYLKLQPYRHVSVASRPFNKLAAKYYGPYVVEAKIGVVAYRLLLPSEVLIHPSLHVSQLKRCLVVPSSISHPPVLHLSSPQCPLPGAILDRRMVKKGNKATTQVLIK